MKQNIPNEVYDYIVGFTPNYEDVTNFRFFYKGDRVTMNEYEFIRKESRGKSSDWNKFPYLLHGREVYFGFDYQRNGA